MNTLDHILKKYNITLTKEQIYEIPNIGRDDMAALFAELDFKIGVEVGVFKGKYSEVLCQKNPQAIIYGVDPWELAAHEPGVFVGGETQQFFEGIHDEATRRMAPYENYIFKKKYSMDAVKEFEDNSLDFVYIDAEHTFPSITNDLHFWLKKIKPGGIMSGHDWAYYPFGKYIHVKQVLLAYMKCYDIRPFFVIGAQEKKEGTTRDRYRSWMFVKNG